MLEPFHGESLRHRCLRHSLEHLTQILRKSWGDLSCVLREASLSDLSFHSVVRVSGSRCLVVLRDAVVFVLAAFAWRDFLS